MARLRANTWTASQCMTSRDYDINFYRDKDLKTVSMHSHDFYELYFFLRGSVSYIVNNSRYKLESGDILLISPADLHQLHVAESPDAYERFVLWLRPGYVDGLSTERSDLALCFETCSRRKDHLIRDSIVGAEVRQSLTGLYALRESRGFGDDVAAELLIKGCLLALCRHALSDRPRTERTPQSRAVALATDYINEHLSESLALETLSSVSCLSAYHLVRLFKRETGITPHQYIRKKRLLLSKRFIEAGLPIVDVCGSCGFGDYSNFFRAFKSEYSITPKEYLRLSTRR